MRKHAPAVNPNSNLQYWCDDQIRLIKNICKAENIDVKKFTKIYSSYYDKWKNKVFSKSYYKQRYLWKTILPVYKIYQQKLTDLNSCDFGDLIYIL